VRQLLSHTAGAPNGCLCDGIQTDAQPDRHAQDLVARLRDRPVPAAVSADRHGYSNLGHLVLAEVVAVAAGEPFEQSPGTAA
jgi:CubicO group peptidase (beta-lactamase class C family)